MPTSAGLFVCHSQRAGAEAESAPSRCASALRRTPSNSRTPRLEATLRRRCARELPAGTVRGITGADSAREGEPRVGGGDPNLGQLQLAPHDVGAEVDRDALVEGDPAGEPLPAQSANGGGGGAPRREGAGRRPGEVGGE